MNKGEYNKIKNELKEYLSNAKREGSWLRMLTPSHQVYGIVKELGESYVYLNPSLIWEEPIGKREGRCRLEDKISSVIDISQIVVVMPMTPDYVQELIKKDSDKKIGIEKAGS